jgi:hypothetical protein
MGSPIAAMVRTARVGIPRGFAACAYARWLLFESRKESGKDGGGVA